MTRLQLRNDAWVRRFWPNCPPEFLDYMVAVTVPAARRDPTPSATDPILLDLQRSTLYQSATRSDQIRLHCLTGRLVRIARDFVVERTSGGRPKRVRSRRGRHSSFTRQTPGLNRREVVGG
jgi:hypothetical protein